MIIRSFLGILLVFFLASCAPKQKPAHPRLPPGTRVPPVTSPSGSEISPEREASNAVIEEGKGLMERGQYDRAADRFQEAVAVDSTNGAAYYYGALVKTRSGEYGDAWGFLEKAEQLLAGDAAWTEKLQQLRDELGAAH